MRRGEANELAREVRREDGVGNTPLRTDLVGNVGKMSMEKWNGCNPQHRPCDDRQACEEAGVSRYRRHSQAN